MIELSFENNNLKLLELANQMKYQLDGILADDHPTYIERAADKEIIIDLKNGKFCYVFSSPQMGKSSLRVRTARNLSSEGFICAHIDRNIASRNPQEWYGGFINRLTDQFDIMIDSNWFENNWNPQEQSQVLEIFIEEFLLGEKKNIVVFIDDLEYLIKESFSLNDFWTTINNIYQEKERDLKSRYNRLHFVPIGVVTMSDLRIDNKANRLFKDGHAIELTAFTEAQITPLMAGLPKISNDKADDFIKQLLDWSGGQPVLTQKIFDLIQKSNLDDFDESLVSGMEIDSLLDTIRRRLTETNSSNELLLESLIKYLEIDDNQNGINCTTSQAHEELQVSGVVIKVGAALRVFNRIYKNTFNREWVKQKLRAKNVFNNRYLKTTELGTGGFGRAFLVKDLTLKEYPYRTIKQITVSNESELPKKQEEFEKEAKILREMDHKNIPKIYDSFEQNRGLFIVQDYIKGQTLAEKFDKIKKSGVSISETQVIQILTNILKTVSYVHQKEVIHRDIKPSNLIEHEENQLSLIDFGAGKYIPTIPPTENQNDYTQSPFSCGYSAPEQFERKPLTGKFSDIYSIGIIAIEAITHINPSQVLYEKEAIKNFHWRENAKTEVLEGLGEIIDQMTCYEAKHRYQSAENVLKALNKLSSITTIPTRKTTSVTSQSSFSNTIITVLLLIIIGLLATLLNNIRPNCLTSFLCFNNNNDAQIVTTPPSHDSQNPSISSGNIYIQVFQGNKKEQEAGIKIFNSNDNYKSAYEEFYKLIGGYKQNKKSLDPSLLIYLNNSKVRYWAKKNNKPTYKIAVMAPTNTETGKSILSGVALNQHIVVNGIDKEYKNLNSTYKNATEALKGEPSLYLEVIIADDNNHPDTATTISTELSKDKSILAVVGSYTSEVTCEAVKVFSKNNIPIISPNSEVLELRKNCDDTSKVFYRTIGATNSEAKKLINGLDSVLTTSPNLDIIVLYKKGKLTGFSADLFKQFKDQLQARKIEIKDNNILNLEDINEQQKIIQKIKQINTPTVIALFPDGGVGQSNALNHANEILKIVASEENKNIKLILGSNPLWSKDIAELKKLNKILLLAVDWSTDKSCSNQKFVDMGDKLLNGEINRTVALAYEATQFISHQISEKNYTPTAIKDKLSSDSKIRSDVYRNTDTHFDSNGNRLGPSKILVTPSSSKTQFELLNSDQCVR